MSRLRADLLLLITALIWGTTFVAQKFAFEHIGGYTFVAARFTLSALLVLPLAIREHQRRPDIPFTPALSFELALLAVAFCAAVLLQQFGMDEASVTNAGFLTGLYVVFVPLICWTVYRQKPSRLTLPAALLSVFGVWLLSGGPMHIGQGDILVILSAIGFAWQITLVGRIMSKTAAPLRLSVFQYVTLVIVAWVMAFIVEQPAPDSIMAAAYPILYAGILSGGIAYTLQVIAQQYAPPADAAIIMGAEAVFAAIAGAWLTHDRLTPAGWTGCALIFAAIILVELGPHLLRKYRLKPQP